MKIFPMSNDKVQYLTAEGLAALKKEFAELKNVKIPEIAGRIDEAKQQGDLSENAEYHQAKEDMAWAQGRLQQLQFILDHAQILQPASGGKEVVEVGNTVTVKVKNTLKSYTIVGSHEADPLQGKISNESPLGRAFIGAKIGEKVAVETPGGRQEYEILDVR